MQNHPHSHQSFRNETGSALFIIFLAVALFATLSYVVTQSGGGDGGAQILETRASAMADDMVLFASTIEKTVSRMVQRGISESDLCFDYNPNIITGYEHAGCADEKNRVFGVGGGGISWRDVQPEVLDTLNEGEAFYGDWFITADTRVRGIGTDDNREIVLYLGYINGPTCAAINRKFDIPFNDTPPMDDGSAILYQSARQFTGGSLSVGGFWMGSTPNEFYGKKAGCFESDMNPVPSGSFHFYYVVLPR